MRKIDNRMPIWRWFLLAGSTVIAFTAFALIMRNWSPLEIGAPVIALSWILAFIRLGAGLHERADWRKRV